MDIFLAHSLGLIWTAVATARRLVAHPGDQLLAAALLVWGNLVVTRLVLVVASHLGEPAWILGASFGLAVLLSLLRPLPLPAAGDPPATKPANRAMLIFGLSFAPMSYRMLVTGYLDLPGDASILNATGWLLGGLALYRLARLGSLGANAALALCWLGLFTGLAVAAFDLSKGILPASAGLLAGLVFFRQWRRDRRHRHAGLAALALILVAGGSAGILVPDLHWSGPPPSTKAAAPSAADDQHVYLQDFMLSEERGPVLAQGLRPAEGPFPLRNLSRFRSVRQTSARLVIPARPGVNRLRIRFSVGVLQRDKTEVEVRFNGQSVRHCQLTRRAGWVDDTLELTADPGENVIEFADVPHQEEPDWRGYLDRYPDVMLYLARANLPFEEGALEHYELSGRAEGRIMKRREIPAPGRGAYFFVFRELQVEGLR
jgi:hypothetical protein